ncbi:hypothetical protein DOM21_03695 [Bacteriovorax stolpii]|uniref:hypothetical protein n=1 Tax=Bacteriovorax stolpii TaxID=960 RepID=UPI0011582CC4|nr:hypothetical protein [Bacteriovorax stolpii]QDK40569.1 hypothetical protein DOM21_03695 [Bacteriovorax stolpii]
MQQGINNSLSCNLKLSIKSLPKECQKLKVNGHESYDFVMLAAGDGMLTSLPATTETDELELLCYRCALNKVEKSFCGRYSNIWNKSSWVSKCPEFE